MDVKSKVAKRSPAYLLTRPLTFITIAPKMTLTEKHTS